MTIKDEELKNIDLTYNAFGNPDEKLLVSVKDALNNTTSYDYNILGSLTSIDQGGISRTFHYDSKNFLDYETHPEKGTINYPLRDGVGNMKSKQDSLGTTSYTYDGVNRLKTIDYGTGTISFNYDGANNRTLMDNPNANIDYTYHENNLLWTKNEIILGKTYTTRFEYDGNDNLTDIYYPSGRHVQDSYNDKNQVTSVTQFGGSINNISYHTTGTSLGLLKSFTCSNGKTTNLTYTTRNLMETIQSGSSILNLLYTYNDKRGNLTSINDYLNGANSQSFTYDELNRLRIFNGSWGTGNYNYYFSGNRSSKVVAGVTTTYNYTNNRLTSTTGGESSSFGYNTNGDATGVNGYTLDYNRLHNLISFKQGTTPIAEYTYDGDGVRVTKTANGTTIVYHYYKDGRVISENDGSGVLIADY
ncbi:MAG: RHS repeat protein, partial [Bacteroidetes bacterium]